VADPSETTRASRAATTEEAGELLGAVRALAAQVGVLQAELRTLRSERGALPRPEADVPGWDVETGTSRVGSAWLRSIPSPQPRGLSVPRLVPEIAFLVLVACLAAVARLEAWAIVALMAGAWGLVALGEWAADRALGLRAEGAFGRYRDPRRPTADDGDRPWLEPAPEPSSEPDGESAQEPAKLPPAASG